MKKILHTILFLFIPYLLLSQVTTLEWLEDDIVIAGEDTIDVLAFEGAHYMDGSFLPYYFFSKRLTADEAENMEYSVSLSDLTTSEITDLSKINISYLEDDFKVISNVTSSRKEYTFEVIIVPFRNNEEGVSRLESFQLNITSKPIIKLKSATSWFAGSSVLASGNWTKVGVKEDGIYKLTYSQLSDMGITPSELSVFTTTPGKLSTLIEDYIDDLKEIPIYDGGDYILFYAQGPNVWNYNYSTNAYEHTIHPYWNENYFYLTSDVGDQKRITASTTLTGSPTLTYSTFVDYDIIEPQEYSISSSGDDWYSYALIDGGEYTHTFTFDNIVEETATLKMSLAAQSYNYNHYMKTYIDGVFKESVSLQKVSNSTTAALAYETVRTYNFTPTSDNIVAKMLFESEENTAKGLVDYFSVEVKRSLEFNDKYLFFRNKPSSEELVSYQLSNAASASLLWDVTNPYNVKSITSTATGDQLSFTTNGDQIKEFVAINPSASFSSPSIIGTVENQNIHGRSAPDMVILTYKDFESVAEDLAAVHREEGLDVYVITQEKIFNEFSGGKADVTAIRWMMKMFYDLPESNFRYLLLLGDGDVNNRLYEEGSSLVMTYQSDESLIQSESYVSDDYFGLLDDSEGDGTNIELSDKVDIGIGRIPISSVSEGNDVVNKIDKYTNSSKRTTWKNRITMVADDEDSNTHVRDADKLAEKIRAENPAMAVKKVYIDAFTQEEGASGHYYPDAKKLSDQYIEEGTLIWSYTGHGSSTALSEERMMYLSEINEFDNLANLPLWVTATCDFCPYDHNDETSAGERVLLNPDGGGIALFTTTRLVYSNSNYVITNNFYSYILASDPSTNEKWRLGDVARLTKKDTNGGSKANKRKFCLIGDPALQLIHADSQWTVRTDSINFQVAEEFTDTIQALSTMTVSGYIEHSDGSVDTDFNGLIYPIVYDKISELKTLGNDDDSSPLDFVMWNSTLYNGQTEVKDGRFTFSFLLPKDIDYTPGKGRIEYYATSDDVEVNGYYEDFYVGGFNDDYVVDDDGPILNLYMNSPSFTYGGIVNPNPMFYADVTDDSGINTSGSSIGHDITIKLNKDPNTIEIINTSYATSVGDYTQGKVSYRLTDLDEGEYTLTFKIWDMQNNSSTQDIKFVVQDDALPEIAAVYCYPNPVSLSSGEMVRFVAEHDRPEKELEVKLNVFDSSGRLVYYSTESSYSASNEVYFDWTPSSSSLVAGLYFYRITIDDGLKTSSGKSQKLILAQ